MVTQPLSRRHSSSCFRPPSTDPPISTTATTNLTFSLYHTRLDIGRSLHLHLLPKPRRPASISSSFRLNLKNHLSFSPATTLWDPSRSRSTRSRSTNHQAVVVRREHVHGTKLHRTNSTCGGSQRFVDWGYVVAQSNTPAAHALRAWAWSSGCSGGFGLSVCSWRYWMLGTGFRGSVSSLVLVVSGCRRATLKFSSPLAVVLLRSLWIVPFPFLVVGLWFTTSFVESDLLRLVFDKRRAFTCEKAETISSTARMGVGLQQ